jgi:Penicillin tolerance protein
MKKLILAETAGFCFGVSRSVDMAEKLIDSVGTCCSFGELIHNQDVIEYLNSKGMKVINSVDEISCGDNILIRAHGLARSVYEDIESAGGVIHDATCPKVKAIHKIVDNASRDGRFVVIIGMRNHPEVEAIMGWCRECAVFENADELSSWLAENSAICTLPLTLVVQTTQTHGNFNECTELIKKNMYKRKNL